MKHIFSVTQINSYIHRIFESDYALKKIYLKGEVSNCKYHSSGHIYFTLKDEKSALRCVMFSSDRYKGLTFHLEDGQLIEACGNISVYEQTGTYQMYVRKIELSGAGELYIRYEQLKQELAQKGYFDFERKKPLPPYPELQEQIKWYFEERPDIEGKDQIYIETKIGSILKRLPEIDEQIHSICEGWRLERLGKPELAILRLAVYEITNDANIPTGVVINEAVELAKIYCSEEAPRFVNGVLAKLA